MAHDVRDDLDLRAVRCLLVLGEERHYGRAAERLHLSQPGLSRAIAALERSVGAPLVLRSSRPVGLTREGEVLAWHGRRLLAQQRAAFEQLAAVKNAVRSIEASSEPRAG
ncbi:MAG: LysR family transcriptional regulator [Solirubrobacteraceae bacterium]